MESWEKKGRRIGGQEGRKLIGDESGEYWMHSRRWRKIK